MPDPIPVQVTMKDIIHGERNKCSRCPIALALARALGVVQGKEGVVSVGPSAAAWTVDGKTGRALLPLAAQDFIHEYDRANTVKPFEFTLHPIPKDL